jgi:hypothetical protein
MDSNHRFLVVGQESLPLDHGTMLVQNAYTNWRLPLVASLFCHGQAEAVGLEPTIRAWRTPVFETGPSSGRMTSSFSFNLPNCTCTKLRGLESNQRPPGSEPGVTTSSNCPAVNDSSSSNKVRGEGLEPSSPASKAGSLPLADPRVMESLSQSDGRGKGEGSS